MVKSQCWRQRNLKRRRRFPLRNIFILVFWEFFSEILAKIGLAFPNLHPWQIRHCLGFQEAKDKSCKFVRERQQTFKDCFHVAKAKLIATLTYISVTLRTST